MDPQVGLLLVRDPGPPWVRARVAGECTVTIDISDVLSDVASHVWDRVRARDVLELTSARIEGSTTDWDEAAGEDWARLICGRHVVAFIWTRGPLAIISDAAASALTDLTQQKVSIVRVPDTDSQCLMSTRSSVEKFAGRPVSPVLNNAQFSAEDLVWAT